PMRQQDGLGPVRSLGEHQDGRLDPCQAEPEALLDERNAEPGRARVERGTRDRDVTVPVGVGLDDGHHFDPRRREGPDVVTDPIEIDLDPRRAEPRLAHRGYALAVSIASGRRSATSPATVPSPSARPAAIPARPWR